MNMKGRYVIRFFGTHYFLLDESINGISRCEMLTSNRMIAGALPLETMFYDRIRICWWQKSTPAVSSAIKLSSSLVKITNAGILDKSRKCIL